MRKRKLRRDSTSPAGDCALGHIPDPPRLANLLSVIPGVVDHGLFIGICGIILMGGDDGVKTFRKS